MGAIIIIQFSGLLAGCLGDGRPATRVTRVQHVASMAMREECKGEMALLPSNGGYYNPLTQMYAESSDESDCDYVMPARSELRQGAVTYGPYFT